MVDCGVEDNETYHFIIVKPDIPHLGGGRSNFISPNADFAVIDFIIISIEFKRLQSDSLVCARIICYTR